MPTTILSNEASIYNQNKKRSYQYVIANKKKNEQGCLCKNMEKYKETYTMGHSCTTTCSSSYQKIIMLDFTCLMPNNWNTTFCTINQYRRMHHIQTYGISNNSHSNYSFCYSLQVHACRDTSTLKKSNTTRNSWPIGTGYCTRRRKANNQKRLTEAFIPDWEVNKAFASVSSK